MVVASPARFAALAPQRLCRSCSNQGVRKTFPVNGSFTSVPGGNWRVSIYPGPGANRLMTNPLFPGTGMAYGTSAFPPFASGAADAVRTLCTSGGPGLGLTLGLSDSVCLLAGCLVLLVRDCDFFCG